jgi:type IV pilus assembly protein PilC
MKEYRYTARTQFGGLRSGTLAARDREHLHELLQAQKLVLQSAAPVPQVQTLRLYRGRKPKPKALVQFYHQFAALIASGIPLLKALRSMTDLTSDPVLRKTIEVVSRAVEEGDTLAGALRAHPGSFSEIAVNVIAAAEEGGTIDVALVRLADYVERMQAVRDRVQAAMIYPGLIVLVTIGSIVALVTLVVPTFEGLFASAGLELPFATRLLLGLSDLIRGQWMFLVVGLGLAFLTARTALARPSVRYTLDRVVLATPVAGRIVRKVSVARFSRTLASLLESGVPVLSALESAGATTGNRVMEAMLGAVRDAVAKGSDIASALRRHKRLPPLLSDMVGVGEDSGRVDTMLGKVADFYEREVDAEVEGLLKALEPALIVTVGVILSGLVVAMYLPIFDMVTAIETG